MLRVGMLVTLRTLHLLAQKDSSRHRRGRHRFIVQVSQQEVRFADFVAVSFCRNQTSYGLSPGAIMAELLTQELGEQITIDRARGGPPTSRLVQIVARLRL